jgi:hypothetical protein
MLVLDAAIVGPWVAAKAGCKYQPDDVAIGWERNGRLVAGVMYNEYNEANIHIHSRVDGYVPMQFYWTIFDYPFKQLGVKRLSGIVYSTNLKAQKLNEHLGFQREAILRNYFPEANAIVYVMFKDDCRFLGEKYVRFAQTT